MTFILSSEVKNYFAEMQILKHNGMICTVTSYLTEHDDIHGRK